MIGGGADWNKNRVVEMKSGILWLLSLVLAIFIFALSLNAIISRIDTIEELWFIRFCNVLAGFFACCYFALWWRGELWSEKLNSRLRAIFYTIMLGVMVTTCLEAWCEGVVHVRWSLSPQSITINRIAIIRAAINDYREHCGAFPTDQQGLEALLRNPGVAGWNGPYASDEETLDSWNRPLRFKINNGQVRVWSVGPDGIDETDDDVE